MRNLVKIANYIIVNNPWYKIPQRMLAGFFYQGSKRFFKSIISKKLFNGKSILLFPNNPICSGFIYTNIPDKNEIFALRRFADKNTIFLDIGANIGAYSLLLLDCVKTVYAFEAHPVTANFCKMNFLLNGVNELQVLPMAVSDNCEPKYFSNLSGGYPTNSQIAPSTQGICVKATTLDDFVKDQQFAADQEFIVKIDVEGFEHEVFNGAKEFLTKFRVKAIIFETFSPHNNSIVNLLQDLGYLIQPMGRHNLLASKELLSPRSQ